MKTKLVLLVGFLLLVVTLTSCKEDFIILERTKWIDPQLTDTLLRSSWEWLGVYGLVLIALLGLLGMLGFKFYARKKDDANAIPKPPKWETPQPIDTLLLGSWELIEENISLPPVFRTQIITFCENNKYINKTTSKGNINELEHHWSVNGDELVMPDFFDLKMGRFAGYTYSFSEDGQQLYVNLIHYPNVGNAELVAPLGMTKGTYKRLEIK